MLPDFNRLKVFYYVFQRQSSTEAAKLLHITQSGVSQHIKKLEQELQVELFTRVNRRLVPTAAGQKLYGVVASFMDSLEGCVRDINEAFSVPSGNLRVGAPLEFGKTYLPRIMASFSKKYPNVTFHLELGDPISLFDKVAKAELDFSYIDILPILMDTPGGGGAYSIAPIVKEEFVLACSKEFYEEKVRGADYEALTQLAYIGYKDDIALFRSWFRLHFETAPAALDLVLVADNPGAIISAIREGLGAGVVVSHLVSEQIARGEIVPITPTRKKLENTIACVRFRNKTETVTEMVFQEHVYSELSVVSNLKLLDDGDGS